MEDFSNLDLKEQKRVNREKYVDLIASVLSLIQQQSKIERISYGDANTRYFFAKAKSRKLASYVYLLQDEHWDPIKGFDAVGGVLTAYYTLTISHLLSKEGTLVLIWKPISNITIMDSIT